MSNAARFLLRLKRRAMRGYELLLYALLLSLALAVAHAAVAGGEELQCGQIQSSTPVMAR